MPPYIVDLTLEGSSASDKIIKRPLPFSSSTATPLGLPQAAPLPPEDKPTIAAIA